MKKDEDDLNEKKELLISTKEEDNKLLQKQNEEEEDNIIKEAKNDNKQKIEEDSTLLNLKENIDIDYYSSANCISSLFYYWAFKIIKLSHKVKITIQHLGKLSGKYSSLNFMKHFYHVYYDLDYKTKSLVSTIFRSNLCTIILVLILGLASTGVNVVQMMIFKAYVALFKAEQIQQTELIVYVYYGVGFLLTKLINIFLSKKINEYQNFVGFKAGVELNCLIFDKLLIVSPSSRHNKAETGEIVNYVQIDSNQLIRFVTMSPSLITIPISIFAYSFLLFSYLGISFSFGLGVLFIFLVINYLMQRTFKKLQKRRQQNMDKRLRMTTAILFNLKVLKLYSWDDFFFDRLNDLREIELSTIRKIFNFRNSNQTVFWLSPIMTTIVTIGAYEYLNKETQIENIFVSLGVLNSLQEPVRAIAMIYTTFLETLISLKRIQKFMNQENIKEENIITNDEKTKEDDIMIKIENGTFSWGAEQKGILNADDEDRLIALNLRDINFTVKKGEFVCIIGEVGSGKSSLLNALLNNMIQVSPEEVTKILNARRMPAVSNVLQIVPEGKLTVALERDSAIPKNPMLEMAEKAEKKMENEIKENPDLINNDNINDNDNYNKVYINGSIAYVCQTPFIQNNTLKNNILFFHEFDQEKYNKVLKISELLPDLEILKGGDMTEIGERGINLSGGQKARVSIARALYSDSDIYLLDDPISALDAHVGRNIINNVLCDYLKDKTRILVTHAIQYCNRADRIVYMKDGKIDWEGDFEQLEKQEFYKNMVMKKKEEEDNKQRKNSEEIDFNNKSKNIDNEDENLNKGENIRNNNIEIRKSIDEEYIDLKHQQKLDESSMLIENPDQEKVVEPLITDEESDKNLIFNKKKSFNKKGNLEENLINIGNKENEGEIKRITKEEDRVKGKLKGNVYATYFRNNGGALFVITLFFILLFWQGLKCGSDLWLVHWKDQESKKDPNERIDWKNFLMYSGLGISAALFVYLRLLIIYIGSISNSRYLHRNMLHHLIKAPINLYHDTVPKGQIFNRLSNDLFKIDIGESFMFYNVSSYSANLLGQIVVCAIFQPYCLALVPFIVILGLLTMRYYLNCSREISRLESISRSPMLNSVNETVFGALTIRAFKLNNFFIEDFRRKVDNFLKTRIFLVGIMNWYTLMLDFLSYMFIIFLILFSIFFRFNFEPATIGILLNYCVQIQDELVRYLTCRSNLENDMVGLERAIAYTKIIQERPDKMPKDDELGLWPSEGSIRFENYSVQYRPETEIVLKNLNFEIKPKEKIGIVGRTGSGKSTIALCLFRILEAKEGKIYMDDVDISQIGLKKLRSNITIIPQDPTLMEGSLKFNIDPLNNHTEQEIENVMREIGFWYICERNLEENKNKPDNEKGLNMIITENGGNISIGERQLICITRAILRKSKIIVMDEATASIDVNTENIIQKAINNLLNDSTILTIAHRIKTVLNSDRILVLDNGEVVEFDNPKTLLANKNSMFYEFYNNANQKDN